MKYLLILGAFLATGLFVNAQSSGGQSSNGNAKGKKTAAQTRGTGQYHGSKDTTPGSPMGTGGAGGSGMSGSPAGSASQSALQKSKANIESGQSETDTASKGSPNGNRKRRAPQNKRMQP